MKNSIIRHLNLMLGIILIAISFNIFFYNLDIAIGDTLGMSLLLYKFVHIDVFFVILILNLFFLGIGYIFLGYDYAKKAIVLSLLIPLFISLLAPFTMNFHIEGLELIIAVSVGAILMSLGYGLINSEGYSCGGTEVVAYLLNKYLKVSGVYSELIVDSLIVISAGIVFGVQTFAYSTLALIIINELSNHFALGIGSYKSFYIWSDKSVEIKLYLLNAIKEDVTIFDAIGGYKNDHKTVIFCALKTNEYYKVKNGIELIDPDSFITITDTHEVINPSLLLNKKNKNEI